MHSNVIEEHGDIAGELVTRRVEMLEFWGCHEK